MKPESFIPNPGQPSEIVERKKPISQEDFEAFQQSIGNKLYEASNAVYLCNEIDLIIKENVDAAALNEILVFCESHPKTHGELIVEIKKYADFLSTYEAISPDSAAEKEKNKFRILESAKSGLTAFISATKKISKFTVTRLLPAYMSYFAIVNSSEQTSGLFSEKDRARADIENAGITAEQASVYKLGLSDVVYRGIAPIWYSEDDPSTYVNAIPNAIKGRTDSGFPASEDAWSMYLGRPQEHGTFGISDYQPKNAQEDKYYYQAPAFCNAFLNWLKIKDFTDEYSRETYDSDRKALEEKYGTDADLVEMAKQDEEFMRLHSLRRFAMYHEKNKPAVLGKVLLEYVQALKEEGGKKVVNIELNGSDAGFDLGMMFNNWTMSCGEDDKGSYISYYDIWDLSEPTENSVFAIGAPFEIYDRIYYNPDTGEIIDSLLSK